RRDLLGDGTGEILRGDHRGIVGAGDGDVDLLGDEAAVLVVEGDGEALELGMAVSHGLHRAVGDGVGPGELAAAAAAIAGWCELLGDGTGGSFRGDSRGIAAAVDGDVDLLGDEAAVLVVE